MRYSCPLDRIRPFEEVGVRHVVDRARRISRSGRPAGGPWIHNRRFDLLFLTLSGVLVFFPYVSYGLLQRLGASQGTASLVVGLSVTLLVGGPHMYSTYLRTALEPRFRAAATAGSPTCRSSLIPTLVVIGSIYSFLLLLDGLLLLGFGPRHAPGAVDLGDVPPPARDCPSRRSTACSTER